MSAEMTRTNNGNDGQGEQGLIVSIMRMADTL
jgi:hypothetical protein